MAFARDLQGIFACASILQEENDYLRFAFLNKSMDNMDAYNANYANSINSIGRYTACHTAPAPQ